MNDALDCVAQDHRTVVLLVARAVHERDRAVCRALRQLVQDGARRAGAQLGVVTPDELVESGGVVPEPSTQLRARRELLRPSLERQRLLPDASRPEPVHEDPVPVTPAGLLVRSLDLHHRLSSTGFGMRVALAQEGSAAFVTQGPDGPHLVATWNSYIDLVEDDTLVFPAGGYRVTEENVRNGSTVQMILGGHVPDGIGFRLTGNAEFQVGTQQHVRVRQRFPWARAAVVLHVARVEQVLGK